MTIIPVILSGGAGTRLWPLSRAARPKQFLALAGASGQLAETARRLDGLADLAAPIVVAGEEHRFQVAEALREEGVAWDRLVLEPEGRNTAPAIAVAAHLARARDPDAVLIVMPSDHRIADVAGFLELTAVAVAAARTGRLVTFGMRADRPETGFGYIEPGAPVEGVAGAFSVSRFIEKPDAARASNLIAEGCVWNSGLFVLPLATLEEEFAAYAPDIWAAAERAVAAAGEELDFLRLDSTAFRQAPAQAFDVAIMERTGRAAVVPGEMGWSDLGSFEALWRLGASTPDAAVTLGPVRTDQVGRAYLRSDGPLLAVHGLHDVAVVASRDAVMVGPLGDAEGVKRLVLAMQRDGVVEATEHATVYRPWGHYTDIDRESGFRVKRLVVNPGGRLSLQRHTRRSEHWVVLSGRVRVQCAERSFELGVNESTFIPIGATHRLENPFDEPAHLIEVQVGSYVGEDDIERLDDVYGRSRPVQG